MKWKKVGGWLVQQRIVMLLVILLVTLTFVAGNFWSLRNQQSWWVSLAIEGIMVVGMTITMIGAGFDLSIGSVMALAGVIAVGLQEPLGVPLAIVCALAAAGLIGVLNGLFITRVGINPFIATLGSMIAVRGLVMTITDGQPVVNSNPIFGRIGRGLVEPVPIPAIVFFVVLVLGHIVLSFTLFGRNVYALGGNEEAANASGIRTNRVKLTTYVICSVTAGISGVILASRLSTGSPIIGEDTALSVITAVLLGGTSLTGGVGTMGGSFAGLLVVGALANGLNLLNVPAYYQRVAKGLLLIIVVVIDSLYMRARRRALRRTRGRLVEIQDRKDLSPAR
jgi:ribose/xylose/arabinose/galactoside ABC-type transport system permease subunit